ncbi:MAG: 4Fe-4S dicluster domain-containing protein [Bradymonadales bacterium]|nr:4Fe-4S dicluster domain-containing protein [Bradymonadales bacterium]
MGLRSFFLLGFQFFLHLLRRIFFLYRPGGVARFLENYREDHLFPFEVSDRELLPLWQRCTACGLCEAVCPLKEGSPIEQGRLSYLVLASSLWRDTSIRRWAAKDAEILASCSDCDRCEQICPERIPLRALARLVGSPPPAVGGQSLSEG